MRPQFDHERLKVYQEALRFAVWAGLIARFSGAVGESDQASYGECSLSTEKE